MAKITLGPLSTLLRTHVCEVKFVRRRPILGSVRTRRMMCTNCLEILNSPQGRTTLNFRPAIRAPKYNPVALGLIVTWDIFMQDYRQINTLQCSLMHQIPVKDWWVYFNKELKNLSADQKMSFMDI